MDVIVRQSRDLGPVIDRLMVRPRHILRRVHRQIPVGRVQEVDRRSMLWLARQPGETLAERAGDDQRILAVAREENYDTLENRVLRAYGELAVRHGRDYLERNQTRRQTSLRAMRVERFAKTCRRMARDLADRGVRSAEAGVTPNFVLQQNPEYHRVWKAWEELLDEERRADDLWRWQARSWEEYCGLALLVAMAGLPGARPVATAPIWYRDENHRGITLGMWRHAATGRVRSSCRSWGSTSFCSGQRGRSWLQSQHRLGPLRRNPAACRSSFRQGCGR